MSEFHKAFYVNCPVHKEIEHPIWRKCPKCSEVITYSEEEVKTLIKKFNEEQAQQYWDKEFDELWFETHKKK